MDIFLIGRGFEYFACCSLAFTYSHVVVGSVANCDPFLCEGELGDGERGAFVTHIGQAHEVVGCEGDVACRGVVCPGVAVPAFSCTHTIEAT